MGELETSLEAGVCCAQEPPRPPKPLKKLLSPDEMMSNSHIVLDEVVSRYLIQAMTVKPVAIGDVAALVMSSAPAERLIIWVAPSSEIA